MSPPTNGSALASASPAKPPVIRESVPEASADGAPADPVLRDYLAARDAPCPACGYNLRGNSNGHCPECGETLALHLQPAAPFARRTGLVLLVFLWLLAASGIQAYLTGWSIHETVNNPFQGLVSFNFNTLTTNLSNGPNPIRGGGSFTLMPDVPGPSPHPGALRGLQTAPNPPLRQLLVTNAGTPNWAAVTWQQWTRAGVWTTLGLAALAGIVLILMLRRRRGASPRLQRAVVALAWSGFGVFCAMHLAGTVLGVI